MKGERGLTLVELLLATTILAMVLMASLSLYRSGIFAFSKYRDRQERIDRVEIVLSALAADLRAATAIEFVELNRLGLRQSTTGDNGQAVPTTIIYEYRPLPEGGVWRHAPGDDRLLAANVAGLTFAHDRNKGTIMADLAMAGLPNLHVTLPAGGGGALARSYSSLTELQP